MCEEGEEKLHWERWNAKASRDDLGVGAWYREESSEHAKKAAEEGDWRSSRDERGQEEWRCEKKTQEMSERRRT